MYLVLGSVIRHWKSSTRVFIGLELRGGEAAEEDVFYGWVRLSLLSSQIS